MSYWQPGSVASYRAGRKNMSTDKFSLQADELLADARKRAGLDDFGDPWFMQPLGVMLEALNREARLSAAGVAAHHERIVTGLVNRLRMVDALRLHPEIASESVEVTAIIVGLPRTGSTLFHRLLTTAPGLTAVRFWEAQNYAPFPGEMRGQPAARRQWAADLIAEMLRITPDLLSIHPYQVDGADEEIMILDQFFVGTQPEAYAYIPSYSAWLDGADLTPAYRELRAVLGFLQWQDEARGGKRWVLKTPGHLAALGAATAVFPEARFVMTHRDPLETVPSYCSMVAALHGAATEQLDRVAVGRFTAQRWAALLDRFTRARDTGSAGRFIDVDYRSVQRTPLAEWRRVLDLLGEPTDAAAEALATKWLGNNRREQRATHHYTLEEFGLDRDELVNLFSAYRERFILDRA